MEQIFHHLINHLALDRLQHGDYVGGFASYSTGAIRGGGADRWCGGLEILSAHHLATVKAHPHVLCDHVHHRLTEDFYRTLYFNLRGGPSNSSQTMVTYIYNNAFRYSKLGYGSALAYVLFVLIFIVSLINLKAFGSDPTN